MQQVSPAYIRMRLQLFRSGKLSAIIPAILFPIAMTRLHARLHARMPNLDHSQHTSPINFALKILPRVSQSTSPLIAAKKKKKKKKN